jgi:glycosyltransferase involved in cell wall biosynthesis
MKIIFDLRNVGLGNNGGSSTLVKSGNMLMELGQEVIFIDSMTNKYTWAPLNCKHKIVRNNNDLPSGDFIIATGYNSVKQTISSPPRCGKKLHWIRAWETWQFPEQRIVSDILKTPTIKLVNSICLQKKLNNFGITSYIVRPGYDFEDLFPLNIRGNKDVILGGLYREGIHGKRKRVSWLLEAGRILKEKYSNIKLWLFGSEYNPNISFVDKYIRSPSMKEKNNFYNQIHIWLAPTMSEGLHLPPAEAMITECPVVGTTAELSGLQDYLIHKQTGLMMNDYLNDFISGAETLYKDKELRLILGANARKKILEIGSRKDNMNKLVTLLGTL